MDLFGLALLVSMMGVLWLQHATRAAEAAAHSPPTAIGSAAPEAPEGLRL
ncbi:MAG: hypothetical protein KJO11_08450 [Gemmatimonadetes bacterium]|nr:hypothetical protein [Gemmatimonadota bacterium]